MFGDLVRVHRRRLGLTQEELASHSGVSVRSIRSIEAGRTGRPRPVTVRLLADVFGLSGPDREQFHHAAFSDSTDRPGSAAGPSPAGGQETADETASRPKPAQLPSDVPGFAGREVHLRRLAALLADGGQPRPTAVVIAAITGMAGIGKTTLAVHWAQRVKDQFPDGQLYVNLRGFDPGASMVSSADALRGFLDALGVPPEGVPHELAPRMSLYRSLVADSRILIVLDNAHEAEQVRPLLPGSSSCVVLVTSRDELTGLVAVDGARPLTLDLPSLDEAYELLERRLGPDRLAAEPQAVADIIVRCGRLPLALAIVAARAANHHTFPMSMLAAELSESCLDALSDPDPASDVRTVFAWSYRHLRADAARLFRLLALHSGPDITGPAAASLAAAPQHDVRAWLAELTRGHLITEHRPGRFTFHDLVRAHAMELVQTQDSCAQQRAAVSRVVDHYLQTAIGAARVLNPNRTPIELPAPQPGVSPERLTSYEEELAWFTAEHEVLLRCVSQADGDGLTTQTWQLAWALAHFLGRRGHWHDQVAVSRIALAAAQRGDDRAGQALAHRSLGIACARIESYAEAEIHLQHTIDLCVELGDGANEAHAHINFSSMLGFQGRHREALEHDRRAMEIARVAGDLLGRARALNAIGWDFAMLGDHEQAIHHCEQALTLLKEQGDRRAQAGTWDSLGYSHHHLGRYTYAMTCYRFAIALFRETGDRYYEASTLTNLMDTLEATRDTDGAREAGRLALSILEDLGHADAAGVQAKLDRLGDPDATDAFAPSPV